jgi:hypothetical protein
MRLLARDFNLTLRMPPPDCFSSECGTTGRPLASRKNARFRANRIELQPSRRSAGKLPDEGDSQAMKQLLLAIAPLALALCAAPALSAQAPKKAPASPHETVTASVGGKTITITYGRPYMKGRKIYGGLVPFDKVWRTGADEATTFTTDGDLMLGSLHVPAGTYALFTIPGASEWTVILNKVSKTWGAFDYEKNKAEDLGQLKAKTKTIAAPVEQLTLAIEPAGGKKATLSIVWETTRVTVPIMVH